jgi:CheY-like chemotaxis protein
VNQEVGTQEGAKDLITQSIELFERLEQPALVAEARGDLALCYWREGAYDEARISLASALDAIAEGDVDLRATLLIRAGIIEVAAQRLNQAMRLYDEAAPLVERSDNHGLKGSLHNEYGLLFRRLAAPENREDYLDRSLIEYAAACFHYEQNGNSRALADTEANLGFLFFTIGRYADAHMHLDRSRTLFFELNHRGTAAQVDDTRARTFLAEGRVADAERLIRSAVRVIERGDEKAKLAEALTTYATVKARLGKFVRSRQLLDRAIEIAETAGDREGAGRAKLTIIEELTPQTTPIELADTYFSAADLLKKSQDRPTNNRLINAARIIINELKRTEPQPEEPLPLNWSEFSLRRQVRGYEKALIERALRDAGGAVTKAAHLLGFRHHQSLISLINSRHRDLLQQRSAVRPRRSHLFSKPRRLKRKVTTLPQPKGQISILHIENQPATADLVKGMLAAERWRVELCTDGDSALRQLTGNDHYDALVIDSDVPGLAALELAQRARKITHRRRMPIVMLSANEDERNAGRAGADAFLKMPSELNELTATIGRLLREGPKNRLA